MGQKKRVTEYYCDSRTVPCNIVFNLLENTRLFIYLLTRRIRHNNNNNDMLFFYTYIYKPVVLNIVCMDLSGTFLLFYQSLARNAHNESKNNNNNHIRLNLRFYYLTDFYILAEHFLVRASD